MNKRIQAEREALHAMLADPDGSLENVLRQSQKLDRLIYRCMRNMNNAGKRY